jgi:predicted nucleotidyltransferase
LTDRIREVLAAGPPVRLAILFGSWARDRAHADSDIDVGIVPDDPALPLATELDLQARLEAACGRPVDVVRLDRASTLLRWEAARTAVLITATAPHELPRFMAAAGIEHADLMTTLGPAAERFRRRVAEAHGPLPGDAGSATR